jgi:diguanylate cyclase (GGDEF)-like protein
MHSWIDYYRILQVHYLAETEVIEGAYKRLARKYHPDVNSSVDSHRRMKQINEAYEWLRDPLKREKYDAEWVQKQHRRPEERPRKATPPDTKAASLAQAVLNEYFTCLEQGNFSKAYELISSEDKQKISPADYTLWRSAVARIFKLHAYECKPSGSNSAHTRAMEFVVMTLEHNTVMDRMEKDIFIKKTVLERKGWRVHIGHQCVKPLTHKFEELTNLLKAKAVIQEMLETYSNTDYETGLLNKKGFIDALEKEAERSERYGNAFSLLMIEVNYRRADDETTITISKLLRHSLRRLDEVGRWGQTSFVVLLPETALPLCIKAALRIRETIKGQGAIFIAAAQFRDSVEDVVDVLHQHMRTARVRGSGSIVSELGLWEN